MELHRAKKTRQKKGEKTSDKLEETAKQERLKKVCKLCCVSLCVCRVAFKGVGETDHIICPLPMTGFASLEISTLMSVSWSGVFSITTFVKPIEWPRSTFPYYAGV